MFFDQGACSQNEMNPNETKDFDLRQEKFVIYQRSRADLQEWTLAQQQISKGFCFCQL